MHTTLLPSALAVVSLLSKNHKMRIRFLRQRKYIEIPSANDVDGLPRSLFL